MTTSWTIVFDEYPAFFWSLVFIVGLLIGSFLNVVIWRVPRGESIVHPGSRCPGCGHNLRWWENIPLFSWLLLRGRCSSCKRPISLRYPLVELATAFVLVAVAFRFGPTFEFLAFGYLACIGIALALIDIDVHRLPDVLVLPSYPIVVGVLALATWASEDGGWSLWRAFIGAVLLFLIYLLAAILYPGGMGLGDVKLAGLLGFALGWTGWGALAVGAFSAFLLGGIFSLLLLATGKAGRKSGIPFGPWMLVGAALGVAAGQSLWEGYLRMFS